ncbi:unnamed protein product [Prorocentrum cordatum]|uniref:Major facilitator superfamily (MFS) profile domain-containing protein n=1 Tax=Prorocentrum cordatum TaxID=2364126 RepID=A0ABN9QE45_9DINO|nr:unnamed protein product [Polarella glacialis]
MAAATAEGGGAAPGRGGGPTPLSVVRAGIGLATDLYDLTVLNALAFGCAADAVGRRPAFLASAALLCLGAAGSATAGAVGSLGPYEVLLAWRLLLGVGIGGEYPLSCAVTAEGSGVETVWATVRGARVCSVDVLRAIWFPLLGTTSTYFLYDVVSWGVGSYTSSIFKSDTRAGTLWYMLLINVMATPGFILTMWMGKYGRRTFQMWGFFGMAACMLTVGLSYEHAPMLVLVLVFGLQKIFDSAGPGATTFIIPGEIFPTSVRATCHGVSAAAGKLGAFAGMYLFPVVESRVGYPAMLQLGGVISEEGQAAVCSAGPPPTIMLVGMAATAALTPPYTARTLRRLRALADADVSRTTEVLWSGVSAAPACPRAGSRSSAGSEAELASAASFRA